MPLWDWPAEVGNAFQLRQRRSELDPDVFPLRLPGVAASPQAIASAGPAATDLQYAGFLATVDGWPDFHVGADLLSTEKLRGSPERAAGEAALQILYEDGPAGPDWPLQGGLVVIAAGLVGADLFALDLAGFVSDGGHPIHWFGEDLVESYPNFCQFFLSANEYVRRGIERRHPGQA